MAEAQYCGIPYRQIAEGLDIYRGPGNGMKRSYRPRQRNGGAFMDDDEPTLITFDELDLVDVADLLRIGHVVLWAPVVADASPNQSAGSIPLAGGAE